MENIEKPLVSILMPVYNAEKYIFQAITSALAQSYKNFELIICNDDSSDRTVTIINSIEDHRIFSIKNEVNLGYLQTFNKLLTLSKGLYITFLDADDLMAPFRIEKQVEHLISNEEVGMVGTNYGRITEREKMFYRSKLPLHHKEIVVEIAKNKEFPFCGSSVMLRAEVLNVIGGYREYFIGCPGEDIDWIRRISEKFLVSNIEYLGYLYRFSTSSLTRIPKTDIKARHITEIINFLAAQREKYGEDDLTTGGEGLVDFENALKLQYQKDPSLLFRRIGFEYSIQKKWTLSILNSLKALKAKPFKLRNYISFIIIFPVLILPTTWLLYTRNLLKVNHVADKI